MEQELLDLILKDTFTLNDLKKRLKALKSKLETSFYGASAEEIKSQELIDWLDSLSPDILKKITHNNLHEVFSELEKKANSLEVVTIYLAFVPEKEAVAQIGSWIRTKINPHLLFETKTDPTLIGGCAFVYKGIYKDFSIKAKIQLNQDNILSSFKNYLKK